MYSSHDKKREQMGISPTCFTHASLRVKIHLFHCVKIHSTTVNLRCALTYLVGPSTLKGVNYSLVTTNPQETFLCSSSSLLAVSHQQGLRIIERYRQSS